MSVTRTRIKKILAISIPAALHYLLGMLQTIIDMAFVGKISPGSVAAVGVSMQYIGFLYAFMSLFYTGTNALISRFTGSGDNEDAGKVVFSMSVTALMLSIPLAYIGIFKAESFFLLLGTEPGVAKLGAQYLSTFSMIIPVMYIQGVMFSAFTAVGDTRTPMFIGIFGVMVNTYLDWILIFGKFGMPAMGVHGAAYALVLTKVSEFSLYLFFGYFLRKIPFQTDFNGNLAYRALRVGIPTWIERVVSYPGYLVMAAFAAGYGTQTLAGYQIGLRIEGLAFMPGIGFMIAGMALTGQNLGAGNPEEAEKDAEATAAIAAIFMAAVGLVMIIFPVQMVEIFTKDSNTVREAAIYLRIIGISQFPLGIIFVMGGSLRGAGSTGITFVINTTSQWIIRLLPAYYFYKNGYPIQWIYWVATIETFLRAAMLTFYFKRGTWKTKQV